MDSFFQLKKVPFENDVLAFWECVPLTRAGFKNAFSTRLGGVSPLPKDALNLAYKNDSISNVDENRRRFFSAIGGISYKTVSARQIHSDYVALITRSWSKKESDVEADILIGQEEKILVGIKTADCLPILIADPVRKAFAAVHAGWRGTAKAVAAVALKRLTSEYGTQPKDCLVAMGPAASGEKYEVGMDVVEAFSTHFKSHEDIFIKGPNSERFFLDNSRANQINLMESGVPGEQIFILSECTMSDPKMYFSHRVLGGPDGTQTGRQFSLIGRLD